MDFRERDRTPQTIQYAENKIKSTNQNSLKSQKLLSQRIRNSITKILVTSVINSPLSPLSVSTNCCGKVIAHPNAIQYAENKL